MQPLKGLKADMHLRPAEWFPMVFPDYLPFAGIFICQPREWLESSSSWAEVTVVFALVLWPSANNWSGGGGSLAAPGTVGCRAVGGGAGAVPGAGEAVPPRPQPRGRCGRHCRTLTRTRGPASTPSRTTAQPRGPVHAPHSPSPSPTSTPAARTGL